MANSTKDRSSLLNELQAACLDATGQDIPEPLTKLLLEAKERCKDKGDDSQVVVTDSDARKYVYRKLFGFLSKECKVGAGASLCYPDQILSAVRKLYPEGIRAYHPVAGKRKRLYEVSFKELLEQFEK